ncbi:3-isopropylmalate dehydrogenase [Candidatus Peregrinibacteria bacterium RIFOXYC2_FULL_33_13]|nr:MAG: 3-isopropylmalate dehydrogenase [Candidatus Peregrinibacteria bacterium RIFOXYA2_FULL_33_7]OGJ53038.1 MAG: 3-isopropylmalate dehydrogenase [Candidatus Peregrinibacteria bacterium RIFOXYC2_FULL_33_13]
MQKKIAVLAGDGIGPEVMREAIKVLDKIAVIFDHKFLYNEELVGGAAYDVYGEHLPQKTLDACSDCDAILFGSVGGPVDKQTEKKWQGVEKNALLGLRKKFNLYANLRPIYLYKPLIELSVLKNNIVENGVDVMILRELTGGIYFGEHKTYMDNGEEVAIDIMSYKESEIRRIIKLAVEIAEKRNKKITVVDKANVLDCSLLWRKITKEFAQKNKNVDFEFMYVDNAAMQLMKNPNYFDVLLTENMFGDILSDLGSVISGSLGMAPSASLNDKNFGLFEPIGGSAQDIAGINIANPIAQILSAALMLKYSFSMIKEGEAIENAVINVLEKGIRTGDIYREGLRKVRTMEMGDYIAEAIVRDH